MSETIAESVDQRLERLRGAFQHLKQPDHDARGQGRVVPQHELTIVMEESRAVQVRVRVLKPTEQHVVLAEFAPDAFKELSRRVQASGLSWEGYFEQVVQFGK